MENRSMGPLTRQQELSRVRLTAPDGKVTESSVWSIRAVCDSSVSTLARCREALVAVLQIDATDPMDEVWAERLPGWLLRAFAPPLTDEQAAAFLSNWRAESAEGRRRLERLHQWALEDWVHWFTSDNSDRNWSWWDAAPFDETTLVIRVTSEDSVLPLQALNWLLRQAGATEVEYSPDWAKHVEGDRAADRWRSETACPGWRPETSSATTTRDSESSFDANRSPIRHGSRRRNAKH